MKYLKKLADFFLLFLVLGFGGIFAAYNLDFIVVTIPYVTEMRLRAAIVYIVIFLAGATLAVIYFGIDAVKKSLVMARHNKKIRRLEERIRVLEAQVTQPPSEA